MNDNQALLKEYSNEEIVELLNKKERLVHVNMGEEEVVARYEDIPDIIVDINNKWGITNLRIYDFYGEIYQPMLTTSGEFLDICNPIVREDIIDRLVKLQLGLEEIKDYKVIDEDRLDDVRNEIKQNEMER